MAADSQVCRELSRRFSAVAKDVTGRGPTKVTASIKGELLTLQVEGTLTEAEQALHEAGRKEAEESRRAIQDLIRDEFCPVVEEVLGQSVTVALSDHAMSPDVGIYSFTLDGDPFRGD